MDKRGALLKLKAAIDNDKRLPLKSEGQKIVFGEGDSDAKIMMIGEAPGFWENKLGRPFVGAAGQLLDELIAASGLKREEVYITNLVKFRPPENRDPLKEEIKAFEPYLDQQIAIVNPKIIVTLGRFSMAKFIPSGSISQIHGKIYRFRDKIVLPFFHPAAALRRKEVVEMLRVDFQKIPALLADLAKPRQEKLLPVW